MVTRPLHPEVQAMANEIMSLSSDTPIALPRTPYGIARRIASVGRRLAIGQGMDIVRQDNPADSILTQVKGSEFVFIMSPVRGWYIRGITKCLNGDKNIMLTDNPRIAQQYDKYAKALAARKRLVSGKTFSIYSYSPTLDKVYDYDGDPIV